MRRFTINPGLAVALLVTGLALLPADAAGQNPDRPAVNQDDRTNPPSGAGGPPSGEQNRTPAAVEDRDARGNDRDLTTARGDGRGDALTTAPGDGANRSTVTPVVIIALGAAAVLATIAFMRTRRRKAPESS